MRVASCELRVAGCELRVASCELRVASCELREIGGNGPGLESPGFNVLKHPHSPFIVYLMHIVVDFTYNI